MLFILKIDLIEIFPQVKTPQNRDKKTPIGV